MEKQGKNGNCPIQNKQERIIRNGGGRSHNTSRFRDLRRSGSFPVHFRKSINWEENTRVRESKITQAGIDFEYVES